MLLKKTRKAVLLAGGMGTRFAPISHVVNKHLFPIYNKPVFYYPLSVLMLIGIKEILIVSQKKNCKNIKKILSTIKNIKVKISYAYQEKPKGITDGIKVAKKFIANSDFCLILGDNFFYGPSLIQNLSKANHSKTNSIITIDFKNNKELGVVQFKKNKAIKIIEKPKKFISTKVVTGLYFYKNNVLKIINKIKLSKRKELEITDLNNILLKKNDLDLVNLGRGTVWMDMGTPEMLAKTSEFVRIMEDRSGLDIANLEEINSSLP
jgi:glucose-1-phosphate thymidylyltransferase